MENCSTAKYHPGPEKEFPHQNDARTSNKNLFNSTQKHTSLIRVHTKRNHEDTFERIAKSGEKCNILLALY